MNFLGPDQRRTLKIERKKTPTLKVCITGATKGLGRRMAMKFAELGDEVFIVSRSEREICELKRSRPNLRGIHADVGVRDDVVRVFGSVMDAFDGELDMFVNCAAQSGGYGTMENQSTDRIESIVRTNLLGTGLCCKFAHDIMKDQVRGGAVFNFLGNGAHDHRPLVGEPRPDDIRGLETHVFVARNGRSSHGAEDASSLLQRKPK